MAAEIESKFKVRTKIVDVDFANHSSKDYVPRIEAAIKDLTVGVLVNNVGMSYDHPEPFLATTTEEVGLILLEKLDWYTRRLITIFLVILQVTQLINCNIVSVNEMTRLILPQMVERKKGVVINISR